MSKPVCYMGIYNEHDIRDMHTVVVRYVTDFKSNPDRVIPLYEHPPVPTTERRVPDRAEFERQAKYPEPVKAQAGESHKTMFEQALDEVMETGGIFPTTERRVPDAQEMRQMLAAMQAGEMTVSRGVELLDMWLAGNYTDDQLPSVAKSRTLDLDEMPWDRIEKLAGQVAALTQLYELSVDQYNERRVIPEDAELLAFAADEQFFLFCEELEVLDIMRTTLQKYLNAAPEPTKEGD